MESIIALEALIKENESKVKLHKRQIERHENGQQVLSAMALASAESHLEEATGLLQKYEIMLDKLSSLSQEELEEKERLHAVAMRKKYFDTQDSRIKLDTEHNSDIKLEALRIIAELPHEVHFEDEELLEIATKSVDLSLPHFRELLTKLDEIRADFSHLTENSTERDIQELATIDFLIPIVVLHFYVLVNNIKDDIEQINAKIQQNKEELTQEQIIDENNEDDQNVCEQMVFKSFPNYQDWWIRELWVSHQAYFALYSWKTIINNACMTTEQKKAWSIIFDRWVFIKKLLNDKGSLAFNYNFAFDQLLYKYVDIKEELKEEKILSIEALIKEFMLKEDLSKMASFHDVNTPYLKYKIQRLGDEGQI
jgi:hypothetical protein